MLFLPLKCSFPEFHRAHLHSEVKVAQSCPTLCNPMDYTVQGILQAEILEWVAICFSRGSSQPRSPALRADSLPAEPREKPKDTGVGSLSLLQRIFLTHGWTWGLLHYRGILYQLSYQGNPLKVLSTSYYISQAFLTYNLLMLFVPHLPGCPSSKESACQFRRLKESVDFISGSGRSPGVGNSNPL